MDTEDSHASSLVPPDLSRRNFVVTSLATGFAVAVQPVSAETITTDSSGLNVKEIKVPTADGSIPAYIAMPGSGPPFATVIVIHEIFGVHEHIKDVCRRLAKSGYLAIAPALYARQGDVSGMSDIHQIIDKVVSKVPESQVATDLDATVAWAKNSGLGDTERLGITGFCWGGRQVWLYAAHNPSVKAAVAWYGPLERPKSANAPANPIDLVSGLKVPVLGLYGGADPGIPVTQVDALREALKAAGKPCEIVVYPDTPHAFFADYRPSYRPQQAADGWSKLRAWFSQHGVV
jgi:carboxymethylenebutenolidase